MPVRSRRERAAVLSSGVPRGAEEADPVRDPLGPRGPGPHHSLINLLIWCPVRCIKRENEAGLLLEANEAIADLRAGKIVGRCVLTHDPAAPKI